MVLKTFMIKISLVFLFISSIYVYSQNASIQVDIIIAQNNKKGFDSRLNSYKSKLTRVLNYSSYELTSSRHVSPSINKKATLSLPGGATLSLTPVSIESGKSIIVVEMRGSKSLNTQVRLKRGGTLILNGPMTSKGQVIVGLRLN